MLVSCAAGSLQIVPNFRVRTIPVLGTTPSDFGMAAAGWILCQLADAPFETAPLLRINQQQVRVCRGGVLLRVGWDVGKHKRLDRTHRQ